MCEQSVCRTSAAFSAISESQFSSSSCGFLYGRSYRYKTAYRLADSSFSTETSFSAMRAFCSERKRAHSSVFVMSSGRNSYTSRETGISGMSLSYRRKQLILFLRAHLRSSLYFFFQAVYEQFRLIVVFVFHTQESITFFK